MTKIHISKLIIIVFLTVTIISCGANDEKRNEPPQDNTVAVPPTTEPVTASSTVVFEAFDWATVPQSSTPIGEFPYLTAPEGLIIVGKGEGGESKTGYSELKDFNKLIMYNGKTFYNAEGKVAKLKFKMKSEDAGWNQYLFDGSIDKYLQSIGAKLLGKLQINNDQKEGLTKDDDMAIYNHIVGDPYNEPVRFYALNHANGKIMFQVYSNTATGDVGVVELAEFQQTIKPPTATK